MKALLLTACLIGPMTLAHAQHDHIAPPPSSSGVQQAVNTHCPIGKEPIDSRTFITHNGATVGFCCPGCDEAFLAWSSERRDAFVLAAREGPREASPPAPRPAQPRQSLALASIYPLANCPVSGQPLGSMGDPVVKTYDGREVRFCGAACVPRFEAAQEEHLKTLDEQIIASQLPYYPLNTCIVAGGELGSMGEPDNFVHQNRLVRFCCAGCRGRFERDADDYIARLDKAAADEQRENYPFQTCIVRDNRLGSMGDPAEVILAGRLVRLCCPPCERDLRADPAKYIAQLDEAWRKAGRPGLPEAKPDQR